MFDFGKKKKEKLYARLRYEQAQNAKFSDGSADNVSYVDNTAKLVKQHHNDTVVTVFRVILALAALFFVALAFVRAGKLVYRYISCTTEAEGYTVSYHEATGFLDVHKPGTMFPSIAFKDERDNEYTFDAECEIGSYPYTEGTKVIVRYSPSDPRVALVKLELFEGLLQVALKIFYAVVIFIIRGIFFRKKYEYE